MTNRALFIIAAVLLTADVSAQTTSDAALLAEQAGRWTEAVRLYGQVLEREPQRTDLWLRVADIHARLGDTEACVASLERAVQTRTSDPSLYARLSQAYASAGAAAAALAAINGALALAPDTPEYVRAQATLATWVGDYPAAQRAYRRVLEHEPGAEEAILGLARVSAWTGDTDEAVAAYRRYVRQQPASPAVWLELARTEGWRGNFAEAADVLKEYAVRFGATREFTSELAAVLARGGRPTTALRLLRSLQDQPAAYTDNLTRAIAQAMRARAAEAEAALDAARRAHPDAAETRAATRVLRTTLASTAEPRAAVYTDSDGLTARRFAPSIDIAFQNGLRLTASYDHSDLEARAGTGLEQVDGADSASHDHVSVGAAQRFGAVTTRATIGRAAAGAWDVVTYRAGLGVQPADALTIELDHSSGFLVVSPRTLGLGLTRTGERAGVSWQPSLRYAIDFEALADRYSDGNERWEWRLAPRRAVARTEWLNLDLGAEIHQFGTRFDFDHGYYDPRRYESYAVTAFPYLKLHESAGLALAIAIGAHRDRSADAFQPGGSITAAATLGIYDPWVLKVTGSATFNQRLASGAFKGYSSGVALARRF